MQVNTKQIKQMLSAQRPQQTYNELLLIHYRAMNRILRGNINRMVAKNAYQLDRLKSYKKRFAVLAILVSIQAIAIALLVITN